VRSDSSAFRELDTLVRNLSDQLAGYRRRALSAEARARELEQILAGMSGKLDEVRQQVEDLQGGRDAAVMETRTLQAQLASARQELQRAQTALAEAQLRATPEAQDQALAEENQLLRQRLGEAREKAGQLTERMRFLRQQVSLGVER
jgi:chromosome segregation ATPase